MNSVTMRAFREEMEELQKTAGFMTNVGTAVGNKLKAVPGLLQKAPAMLGKQVDNAGKTISAFSTPGKSLASGGRAMVSDFSGMGTGMKALMGYGAVMSGRDAIKKEDPTGQGRSRLQRSTAFAGEQMGSVIGQPFGLAGAVVGGAVGKRLGSGTGKALDLIRGRKATPTPPTTQGT